MTTTITIYHGYDEDGRMVFPYFDDQVPHILVRAYAYETNRTQLDEIWRDNNAVDGTEMNVLNKARSLSIGDVIAASVGDALPQYTLVTTDGFKEMGDVLPARLVTQDEVRDRQRRIR